MPEQSPEPVEAKLNDLFADIVSADHPGHERMTIQHIDQLEKVGGVGLRALANHLRPIETQLSDGLFDLESPVVQADKALEKSVVNRTLLPGLLAGIVNYGLGNELDDVDEVLGAAWTEESYLRYKPM